MSEMKEIRVIPQVFYDLIARIVPGGVCLVTLIFAVGSSPNKVMDKLYPEAQKLQGYAVLLLATFLMASFLLGHLISAVCQTRDRENVLPLLRGSHNKILAKEVKARTNCTDHLGREFRRLLQEEFAEQPSNWDKKDRASAINSALYFCYDWLRLRNAELGGRLAKLRAEYHMRERLAQVFFVGIVVKLVATVGHYLVLAHTTGSFEFSAACLSLVESSEFLLICGIGYLASAMATTRACELFISSVFNHYIVINARAAKNSGAMDHQVQPTKVGSLLIRKGAPQSAGSEPLRRHLPDGERKILVTRISPDKEEEATGIIWTAPNGKNAKWPVQQMADTELAVFTEDASQDLHYHKEATEIYTVIEGMMTIKVGEATEVLHQGDTIVVNPGTHHQVLSNGKPFRCQVVTVNCQGPFDKYPLIKRGISQVLRRVASLF